MGIIVACNIEIFFHAVPRWVKLMLKRKLGVSKNSIPK